LATDNNPLPVRVFVSYAREDKKWLDPDYRFQIIPFLRDSLLVHGAYFWFDKKLVGGDEFRVLIEAEIDKASIALLLVSQSFLNSEFIRTHEMPRILQRAGEHRLVVVPVLVEPCDWIEYPFLADRQMVPSAEPLINHTESERAWAHVRFQILDSLKTQVRRIRLEQEAERARELARQAKPAPPPAEPKLSAPVPTKAPPPEPTIGRESPPRRQKVHAPVNADAIPETAEARSGSTGPSPIEIATERPEPNHPQKPNEPRELGSLLESPIPPQPEDSNVSYWTAANTGAIIASLAVLAFVVVIILIVAQIYKSHHHPHPPMTTAETALQRASTAEAQGNYSSAFDGFLNVCSGNDYFSSRPDRSNACSSLADMYGTGTGVAKDVHKWEEYYGKSCDLWDAVRCNTLGNQFYRGTGVNLDYRIAADFYKKACDDGVLSSCHTLGFMYEKALGLPRNYSLALALNSKACDGGYTAGCNNLGSMYAAGEGVPIDYPHAVALYTKACEGSVGRGCTNLGLEYQFGRGVTEDLAKAKQYLDQGCKMGDQAGCDELKKMQQPPASSQ